MYCYDCNHYEALHANRIALGLHAEQGWFQKYWDQPPAARFSWYWPYERRSATPNFLTEPPTGAAGRAAPRPWCSRSCAVVARGALAAGVFLPGRRPDTRTWSPFRFGIALITGRLDQQDSWKGPASTGMRHRAFGNRSGRTRNPAGIGDLRVCDDNFA